MKSRIVLLLLLLGFPTLAFQCQKQGPLIPKDAIGLVERVNDVVLHNETGVKKVDLLKQDDSLRMLSGGEGMLYFSGMKLRMFNDTQLGKIRTANAPDSPIDVKIYLFAGGFTGQLFEPGSKATFETPNKAKIYVYGTQFFIVHDQFSSVTTAANYDGSIEIEDPEGTVFPIQPGFLRQVSPEGKISDEGNIPFSIEEFENQARTLRSPVQAIAEVVVPTQPPPPAGDVTPPQLEWMQADPERIAIGVECPGAPGTTQLTIGVFDESPIESMIAHWSTETQKDQVRMDAIDDYTYTATIGPVETTGTLFITIEAIDMLGNGTSYDITVEVLSCIG